MKYCKNCGNKLEEGQQVCLNCGTLIDGNVNSNSQQNAASVGGKSKIAAGLLGIILGSLGIHNFYLGYTGKATAQLLLTLLSCGILSPIVYIWGLIEGIMILTGGISTDANGNPLSD